MDTVEIDNKSKLFFQFLINMSLDTYIRDEGKHYHDSLLYRRLALLPGLCNGKLSGPSGVVLKGEPAVPALQNRVEDFVYEESYIPGQRRAPVASSSRGLASSDTKSCTLKRSIERKRAQRLGGGVIMVSPQKTKGSKDAYYPRSPNSERIQASPLSPSAPSLRVAAVENDSNSGFEGLHKAIRETISHVSTTESICLTDCLTRLSAHVKAYTHNRDSEKLLKYLTNIKESICESSTAPTHNRTGLALFMLDHVFYLMGSIHPALKSVMLWCRQEICAAVFAPETNTHPDDFGKEEPSVSGEVYTGPPLLPNSEDHLSIYEDGYVEKKLESYSGRMTYEDNIDLQQHFCSANNLMREERVYTMRLLVAEKEVSKYYQRTVTGILFKAWRQCIRGTKSDRQMAEEKLLLERELSLAKRATAEQAKEKNRVEACLYEQITKVNNKAKELAKSLATTEQTLKTETSKLAEGQRELFQIRAEKVIQRDRVKRMIAKVEEAEVRDQQSKKRLQESLKELSFAKEAVKQHDHLVDQCKLVIKQLHYPKTVRNTIPISPGILGEFTQQMLQSISTHQNFCNRLAEGLHNLVPLIITTKDITKTNEITNAIELSKKAYELLVRVLGSDIPFHPNSFLPPVLPRTVGEVMSLIVIETSSPKLQPDTSYMSDQELSRKLNYCATETVKYSKICSEVVKDLIRWPSDYGKVPVNPSTSIPSKEAVAGMLPRNKSKYTSSVLNRMAEHSTDVTLLAGVYSSIYLIRSGVKEMMLDTRLSSDVQKAVLQEVPQSHQTEITPSMLSTALLKGALVLNPHLAPDLAFESFMHDSILRYCGVKEAFATTYNNVLSMFYPKIIVLFGKLGPNNGIRFSSLQTFFENCSLLGSDMTDSWHRLNQYSLRKIFDTALRLETTNLQSIDLHQFVFVLLLTTQMYYPLATIAFGDRFRRFLEDHILKQH